VPRVGDVEVQVVDVVAGRSKVAGVGLAEVVEDVGEQHRRAVLGEAPAVRGALSAAAAGDERRLAGEPAAHTWSMTSFTSGVEGRQPRGLLA
jgi:hypothetical protein